MEMKDIFDGEDILQRTESDKYLGDIITNDVKTQTIFLQESTKVDELQRTLMQLLWKCLQTMNISN